MKKSLVYFFLLFLLVITACAPKDTTDEQKNADKKLFVYTTVYPLKYFTEEIGKDYVTVETIYPPGSDEHTFEPSQKDMIQLAESDLFIYVGLGLEGFVDKAKKTLENEEVALLAAGEHIHLEAKDEDDNHDEDHGHEHNHGDIDPHVWIDPIYAKELAEAIKNELIKQLPNQKEQLESNYEKLASKLDELDNEFESLISESGQKEFIVSHAAYGYWERYGLEQISISGMSSSSEPTQKELKEIILTAKEHNLKYIFFEQNVSSRLAEIVQDEMNAEPLLLHNLSVLTDEDISNERTYFSIMEDNLKALKTALKK